MRLKVIPVPPGHLTGCRVVNAETGEELEELVCVTYVHRAGEIPQVIIELGPPVIVDGDLVGEGSEIRTYYHTGPLEPEVPHQ